MSNDFTLKQFSAEHSVDTATRLSSYIDALEAFDGIEQLQELKACERERIKFAQGNSLLDVGCGFGLETLRYAGAISAKGKVAGIDTSADFIDEARRRATAAGLDIDFRVGDANALPYPEGSFDCVRAERILIYLEKPEFCGARDAAGVEGWRKTGADRARLFHDNDQFEQSSVGPPRDSP